MNDIIYLSSQLLPIIFNMHMGLESIENFIFIDAQYLYHTR